MKYETIFVRETVKGCPIAMHTFNPVSDSKIVELNTNIDGKSWKYLAYASNVRGSMINLYMSDTLDGEWESYSQNPILDSKDKNNFRWPSTVFDNGVFHMFLDNNSDSQLEHWTSTDGIHFAFVETVYNTNPMGNYNPFIWKNPNDNNWYLYWQNTKTSTLHVTVATNINDFRNAVSSVVITAQDALPSLPAAPSVIFKDGRYILTLEGFPGNVWHTYIFSSKSPIKGFAEMECILTQNEACAMIYNSPDEKEVYLFVSRLSERYWIEDTHKIKII